MDISSLKSQFPILKDITYLDSASTTQKPTLVVKYLSNIYESINANVHRGMYPLALQSDRLWINAHEKVATYINAQSDEIFFTKNATEGFNWIALTLKEQYLKMGDIVLISNLEHHSNYLPWKRLEKEGIQTVVFNSIDDLKEKLSKYEGRVKVVSILQMSNVLGTTFDIKTISSIAHQYGSLVIVDGTQSIAHMNIDVKNLDCDFFIFSSHKVYGPNGVGVVYGKKEYLEKFEPIFQGGEMVDSVSSTINYAKLPFRFEAGTPNIADGITLAYALDWFSQNSKYLENEKETSEYLYNSLKEIPNISLLTPTPSPIVSFNINDIHPHDIASDLGEMGICVRAGYHCVQPYHESIGIKGSVRVSLGIYNDKSDIDRLIVGLNEVIKNYE